MILKVGQYKHNRPREVEWWYLFVVLKRSEVTNSTFSKFQHSVAQCAILDRHINICFLKLFCGQKDTFNRFSSILFPMEWFLKPLDIVKAGFPEILWVFECCRGTENLFFVLNTFWEIIDCADSIFNDAKVFGSIFEVFWKSSGFLKGAHGWKNKFFCTK